MQLKGFTEVIEKILFISPSFCIAAIRWTRTSDPCLLIEKHAQRATASGQLAAAAAAIVAQTKARANKNENKIAKTLRNSSLRVLNSFRHIFREKTASYFSHLSNTF